ncbi:hypothetical protein [Mesorhizobium sp. LNHC221B00]|uniref:hypothetical protein n=1 Tax=Mesorhizobium sp. LNHC221B00 TaxID=1287233 RepID=UPI0012EB91C4|nr:hypothetical protein [Mesorhizobium sp. LNHC221B00]
MRIEDQMRSLRDIERRIRASEFWRAKTDGVEAAVRRLYLTGGTDCGGAHWPSDDSKGEVSSRISVERKKKRKFEVLWARSEERAKSIDWQRLSRADVSALNW